MLVIRFATTMFNFMVGILRELFLPGTALIFGKISLFALGLGNDEHRLRVGKSVNSSD